MSGRAKLLTASAVAAAIAVAGAVWAVLLLLSQPTVDGFTGPQEKCFSVLQTPDAAAPYGHRRQIDDQARLNKLQPDDTEDVPRLTDDCDRVRQARIVLAAVVATPVTLVALAITVTCVVLYRRTPADDVSSTATNV